LAVLDTAPASGSREYLTIAAQAPLRQFLFRPTLQPPAPRNKALLAQKKTRERGKSIISDNDRFCNTTALKIQRAKKSARHAGRQLPSESDTNLTFKASVPISMK
jgi:hypothetical protein